MSKEWLEELINDLPYSIRHDGSMEPLIKFVKEQAERAQELEYRNTVIENRNYELEQIFKKYQEVNKNMYDICGDLKFENLKLEQQNKRYREAIERALVECVKDRPISAEKILAKALEESE